MPRGSHTMVVEAEVTNAAVASLERSGYVCKPFSSKLSPARIESLLRPAQTTLESYPSSSASSVTLDRVQLKPCVGERTVSLSNVKQRTLATPTAARGRVAVTSGRQRRHHMRFAGIR